MRQNGATAAESRRSRRDRGTDAGDGKTPGRAPVQCLCVHESDLRPAATPELSVFLTELGWFGLVGGNETVAALTIGHTSAAAVRQAAASFPGSAWERPPATLRNEVEESDWNPDLRRRLQAFARGERCDFHDCAVALPALTPFQQRVIAATCRIAWGQTLTYGELAERAGAPRAARAVGTVMAANRVPIIIPCHRVVASGGRLGGYSAPQGIELKRRLLAMEAAE